MGQKVYQHTLANGMVLLGEKIEHVRSAAINFLVPAGAAYDPSGKFGTASVLAELITRGAGDRDSRELALALDNLGLDRDESVGAMNMRFWGSTLSRNLTPAFDIYADILRRPHLPEEELEPVQALAFQDIQGLEDAPQQKVMVELKRRYYPSPLNKDRRGRAEDIASLTIDDIRDQYQQLFGAAGSILSVAGNFEWEEIKTQVENLFGDWPAGKVQPILPEPNKPESAHLEKDTQQTQLALAFPSVPIGHPEFYAARAAASVLSGGMSSRLFTEVREKRGLCYSIYAFHETFRDRGTFVVAAGTRAERAQETLDVTVAELRRLKDGISDDEVDRVKAGLKSALIMQEESTSARAGGIATDWYYLGRIRPTEEIQAAIDALTPQSILHYLEHYPVRDMTLVTLGKTPLTMPE